MALESCSHLLEERGTGMWITKRRRGGHPAHEPIYFSPASPAATKLSLPETPARLHPNSPFANYPSGPIIHLSPRFFSLVLLTPLRKPSFLVSWVRIRIRTSLCFTMSLLMGVRPSPTSLLTRRSHRLTTRLPSAV